MAEQFYSILTSIGKAKIANANALGNKLNLTTLVLGDGNGKYYNPTENQEALVNEVWKGNISSITTDSKNPNWIVIETIVAGNVGGFFIREVGIFDDEGSLIAIGKYPETYKPVISDGSTKDLIIRMILEVSNSANVTLKIDPAIIMATKKDVEVLENKIRDLKGVYAEDLLDETVIIEGEMHPLIKNEFEKVETKINENKENLESQMADITKQVESIEVTAEKTTLDSSKFVSKNVKEGMEELFTVADNGKKSIATVIGQPLQESDTFLAMKNKIQELKNNLASSLTVKGQNSTGVEGLNDLIKKIERLTPNFKIATGTIGFALNPTDTSYTTATFSTTKQIDDISFKPQILFCYFRNFENSDPGYHGVSSITGSTYHISSSGSSQGYLSASSEGNTFGLTAKATFNATSVSIILSKSGGRSSGTIEYTILGF